MKNSRARKVLKPKCQQAHLFHEVVWQICSLAGYANDTLPNGDYDALGHNGVCTLIFQVN